VPIRKFGVGPSKTWSFEYRISGPAIADMNILRSLADNVLEVLREEPLAGAKQTNWRQKVPRIVPVYNQERARLAGVSRENVANATKRAYDGRTIGLYREQDELLPIILRHVEDDKPGAASLDILQVNPGLSTTTLPMAQVIDGVEVQWEETRIYRRDRRRTITVQANPILGVTLPTLMQQVKDKVEAIVMLFNAYKPPIVILLTIPFAMIGITLGLLGFNAPFGFMALLGAMSLAGMMIKNAIVLLDEVNVNLGLGKNKYDSVIDAAMSRLRPVVLAAATTVLGVVPLLQDVFWIGMAVTIMAGLAFGTILTMLVVPVLYTTFYRIPSPKPEEGN
jgi:multidrug efflux pump subunit AcrB